MKRIVLVVVVLAIGLSAAQSGAAIRVKWDSPGPPLDGYSWETAFHSVQEGIDAAYYGEEVWVARGTYVERITLKDGVAVYGGFAGWEYGLHERDWTANETVLDGNAQGSVVTCPYGAGTNTRIDGFTIRNGSNGGVFCSGSATIANNLITRNEAGNYGGGIHCDITSSPRILSNRIERNSGNLGGGIYCHSPYAVISNNSITDNEANGGGGIYCESGSSPLIANNTIVGNSAVTFNGGAMECESGSATICNNIVAFNSPGIYVLGGTPTFRNNCVYENGDYNYAGVPDPAFE